MYNLYFLAQIQLHLMFTGLELSIVPANIHLINVNNGKTGAMIEIYLKLTIQTPKRLGVFPLLALNKWIPTDAPVERNNEFLENAYYSYYSFQ